eukprot:768459-Hanusia_phi.AAC.10
MEQFEEEPSPSARSHRSQQVVGLQERWFPLFGRGKTSDRIETAATKKESEPYGAVRVSVRLIERAWLDPAVLVDLRCDAHCSPDRHVANSALVEECELLKMRLLNLNVVACSGLKLPAKLVPSSLMCVCHVGKEQISTRKVKSDADVVWDDKFSVPIERGASQVVRVDVVQETNKGKQDRVGSTLVDLSLFDPLKWHDEWFLLEGDEDFVSSVLRVQVRQACHLPAMDRNGKSDPYCILRVIEEGTTQKESMLAGLFTEKDSQKTKIISGCLDPVWNDVFLFKVSRPSAKLQLLCYDHDTVGRHDLIGECFIEIASLQPFQEVSRWTQLYTPDGEKLHGESEEVENKRGRERRRIQQRPLATCVRGACYCSDLTVADEMDAKVTPGSNSEEVEVDSKREDMQSLQTLEDEIESRLKELGTDNRQVKENLQNSPAYLAWARRALSNFI